MYIKNQSGTVTVNSTSLTSINVEKTEFVSDWFSEEYPDAHSVVAYGKNDTQYLLGVYASEELAIFRLNSLHRAMGEHEKTFSF